MSYTNRFVLFFGPERQTFIEELNKKIKAKLEGLDIKDIFIQNIGSRSSCIAMMACNSSLGTNPEVLQDLLKELNPEYGDDLFVVWTSEHGDCESMIRRFDLTTDRAQVEEWGDIIFTSNEDQHAY